MVSPRGMMPGSTLMVSSQPMPPPSPAAGAGVPQAAQGRWLSWLDQLSLLPEERYLCIIRRTVVAVSVLARRAPARGEVSPPSISSRQSERPTRPLPRAAGAGGCGGRKTPAGSVPVATAGFDREDAGQRSL
jgi:hypothetical protein